MEWKLWDYVNKGLNALTFLTEIRIIPAAEEILLIPLGFAVTNEDDFVFARHFENSLDYLLDCHTVDVCSESALGVLAHGQSLWN